MAAGPRGGSSQSSFHTSARCPTSGQTGSDPIAFDLAVDSGADEDGVDLDLLHRRAGLQAHIFQCALNGLAAVLARGGLGVGHPAGDRRHVLGRGAPGWLDESLTPWFPRISLSQWPKVR